MLENGHLKHAYEFGAMNRMTKAMEGMGMWQNIIITGWDIELECGREW